jgi:phosphoglycolate phosphatase-like HAD superfamily hydrolase
MSQSTSLPHPELIIFDVDGTLVDVTRSYRETAPAAARIYLELLGVQPPVLTGDVYDTFKRMTGFNDDWDLTAGLLRVLLAGLSPASPLPDQAWLGLYTLIAALQAASQPLAGLTPPLPDWEPLVASVRAAGGGLAGLSQVIPDRNAHLVRRTGDAATTDLVQRIFSEVYLGAELFTQAYGCGPRFHTGPGLREHETLLIHPTTLETLIAHARLGIATGRARFEMAPLLADPSFARLFSAVATMSDALETQASSGASPGSESLLKPHPFLLQRAADALDPTGRRVAAYVGDAPDDIIAARRANAAGPRRWIAIGIASTSAQAEHYRRLGADIILAHPDELAALWADS